MTPATASVIELLDAGQPSERARWLAAWESWPRREVFAHPDYVNLYVDGVHERALAAYLEYGGVRVLYPFLLRRLEHEQWWSEALGAGADITSPYGYGGAFMWGGGGGVDIAPIFWAAFDAWARSANVVTDFVRLALFEEDRLPHPGTCETRAINIVRSLDIDDESLWRDVAHKVRKNVRRAEREGVRISIDHTGARCDEFQLLYQQTMDRRGAGTRYYFPQSYFQQIHERLPGQFVYFHADIRGRMVSTELLLVSAENVYSFLGGTDVAAFDARPNDLLKYEVIRWARWAGKRRYVLGGGYQPDDGIFRYKLSFAPHGQVPFRVGQRVLNADVYEELLRGRLHGSEYRPDIDSDEPAFFPAYRA